MPPPPCATGLTTGALCIHTFSCPDGNGGGSSSSANNRFVDNPLQHEGSALEYSCSVDYFHTPQNKRAATAVAWQPQKYSVAIAWANRTNSEQPSTAAGAVSSSVTSGGGGVGGVGNILSASGSATSLRHRYDHRGGIAGQVVGGIKTSSVASGLGRVGAAVAGGGQSSDRDYGCFVWDCLSILRSSLVAR